MYKIILNKQIAKNVYKLVVCGDTSQVKRCGQFINILVNNHFLRRPFSICDYDKNTITVIYKVFGSGTKTLSKYKTGDYLDCLVGLGNGYVIKESKNIVLIGGGVGIPPLYNLAKTIGSVDVVMGFKNQDEVFLVDEFKQIGCNVILCLEDGSGDFDGTVVDYIKDKSFDYYYACGPEKMLLSLVKTLSFPGQLSFEERMGCGFGACMGCSKLIKNGMVRVCVEGPVLESEVVNA